MAQSDSPMFQPSSLRSLCLENVADNIPACFQTESNPGIQLSSSLSDELLWLMDQRKQLTVQTLPAFSREQHVLRHLRVSNLHGRVEVLQTFRGQPLETVCLTGVYVLEAFESLGQEIVERLKAATVRETNSFIYGMDDFNPFTRLTNVVMLNVPATFFSNGHLREVAETLRHVKWLNLSNTDVSDVSPLLAYSHQLMWLSLRGLHFTCVREAARVWTQLEKLRFLDVSFRMPLEDCSYMLEPSGANPDLERLVMARVGSVPEEVLRSYLESHESLVFLDVSFNEPHNDLYMGQYSMFDPSSPAFMDHIEVCSDVTTPQIERGFEFSLAMKYENSVKGYAEALFNHVNSGLNLRPQSIELLIQALAQMDNPNLVTMAVLQCVSAVMLAEQKVSVNQLYRLVEPIVKVISYCNSFGSNVPFFHMQDIQSFGLQALEKILEWSVPDFRRAGMENKKYKSGGQCLWFIYHLVDVAWTCAMNKRNRNLSLQGLTVAGYAANQFHMSLEDCESLCTKKDRVTRVLHLLEYLSYRPPSPPTSGAVGLMCTVFVNSPTARRHMCGESTMSALWRYLDMLCGRNGQFHEVNVQRDVILILIHFFLAKLDNAEGCEKLPLDYFYNDPAVSILRNHLLLRDPQNKYMSVQHGCGFLLALMVTQGQSHWSNAVTEYSLEDALQLVVNAVDEWGDGMPDDLLFVFWFPQWCEQLLRTNVPAVQLVVVWEMYQLCASTYQRGEVYTFLNSERGLEEWLRSVEPGEGIQQRVFVMVSSILQGFDEHRNESRSY